MENINYNNSTTLPYYPDTQKVLDKIQKEICPFEVRSDGSTIYYKSNFLDFSNDEIVIKIEFKDDQIRVSDNNRTILSLLSSGLDPFSTKNKEYLIHSIAGSCGVEVEKYGEVYITTNYADKVGELVYWMIHAIQRLTAAVIVGKTYRPPSFKKDVSAYLTENKKRFTEDPLFYLGRRLKARIDFLTEKDDQQVVCRALSYPQVNEAVTYSEKFVQEVSLINEKSRSKVYPVAIVDDSIMASEGEPVFNEDVVSLLKKVRVVPWSEKDTLLEIFPS